MHIRSIQAGDRAEWLRMLLALYAGTVDSDHLPSIDRFFARDPGDGLLPEAVFVCERAGGGLSGFLELSVRNYAEGCAGSVPYIESWYVDPDARSIGTGRGLIGAAETWARAAGYSELASDAVLDNIASHSAHRAVGFDEVE